MRISFRHAILVASLILLVMGNLYLVAQNRKMNDRNRSLILQNDSLLSVGIELNKKLKGDTTIPK